MSVSERVRDRLAATTRFADVRHFDQIDSTNRWLRDEAAAGAPEGLVAVSDHQTSGRGRLGRTWEAPPRSGLMMSALVRPPDLAVGRFHLVTAATGLAARAACQDVGGFTPDLKWPNDLLVGDAKLAGILAEATDGGVVVGVGLNLTAAPPGAVTAEAAAGRPVERDALLEALLGHLDRLLGDWDGVATAYRQTCATVGRRVRVDLAGGVLVGVAEALDESGRLIVRPDSGGGAGPDPVTVAAGDVIHLRPDGEGAAR